MGDTIILNCSLPGDSKCSWKRNNQPTKITGRYKFLKRTKSSVNGQTDCSFRISNFKKLDSGKWQCENPSSSSSEGSSSDQILLYMCPGNSITDSFAH